MNKVLVYQTSTHGYNFYKVALEFAMKYFDKPRQIENMNGNQFTLENGIATYEIYLIKGIHLISSDVYQVFRIDRS